MRYNYILRHKPEEVSYPEVFCENATMKNFSIFKRKPLQ